MRFLLNWINARGRHLSCMKMINKISQWEIVSIRYASFHRSISMILISCCDTDRYDKYLDCKNFLDVMKCAVKRYDDFDPEKISNKPQKQDETI